MNICNQVNLIGRLGKDPETAHTSNEMLVVTLSLATNERQKQSDGTWADKPQWHQIKMFDRLAERAANYLLKGQKVAISGRLDYRQWMDKDTGKNVRAAQIIAHDFEILAWPDRVQERTNPNRGSNDAPAEVAQVSGNTAPPVTEDDIPF